MKKSLLAWIAPGALVVGFLLVSSSAAAQEGAGNDKVVYKKRTVIDFSDAVIEGELTKPEGAYVVSRKASKFSNLIKVRMTYAEELGRSAAEL